ncbi:MAG TPA: M20/M25/M40 family metallo-hydrolase [Thermoanaerobaculia bacterium]|nr:M20/M25/M40 family metallo-hydrolase [Thermoanaerobaculia bacterium]
MSIDEEQKRRRHRNERVVAFALIALAAIAAWWILRVNRATDEALRAETSYIPKPTTITPEVELLQQYIRFDTTNPPGNELPAAQWLASLLARGGVQAEVIESAPSRASVYARIEGRRRDEGLLLLHHIDVIGATPDGWKKPPFAAEIFLNQLYGRGAIDMKGVGICFLAGFLEVARSGRVPERDIVFLAVADEETGSDLGMRWLMENRPDVIAGVRYALNEGGITEMQQEKMTYYGIEVGTKQSVTVELEAGNREALQRARIALEPWFISREAHRVLPEVRRFLADIAPQRIEFRMDLEDIDRTIANGRFWRLPAGYREVAQNLVWADGVVRAEDGFTMRTLLLNLPDENPDQRLRWLESQVRPFGVRIGRIVRKEGPVPISSTETPLYDLLRLEAERAYGARVGTEVLVKSFNDSRFLRTRGIAAYGINPFPIDFFQSESIHSTDERIRVDYFQQGVEFTRRLVAAFAFSEVTQSVSKPP